MADLELASTIELIKELTGRSTFAGVVIHSKNPHTREGQIHSEFEVSTSMCPETTIRLLETVSQRLEME